MFQKTALLARETIISDGFELHNILGIFISFWTYRCGFNLTIREAPASEEKVLFNWNFVKHYSKNVF